MLPEASKASTRLARCTALKASVWSGDDSGIFIARAARVSASSSTSSKACSISWNSSFSTCSSTRWPGKGLKDRV